MLQQGLHHDGGRYLITINPSKILLYLQRGLPLLVAIPSTFLFMDSGLTDYFFVIQSVFFLAVAGSVFALQKYLKHQHLKNGYLQFNTLVKFEIDDQSRCYFTFKDNHQQGNRLNQIFETKLNACSRESFLGCWLYFDDKTAQQFFKEANFSQPWFIFRDSLKDQDYSRLARIIKMLALEKNKLSISEQVK